MFLSDRLHPADGYTAIYLRISGYSILFPQRRSSVRASGKHSGALALLLRKIRFKKIAAVAAIPVVYVLFLFSSTLEIGIFSPSQVSSFDYVYDTVGDAYESAYYDDQKDVLIVKETEYPPESVPNPEHLTGIAYAGAIIYEVLDPYTSTSLSLVKHEADATVSLFVLLLYMVKGVLWMVIPAILQKKGGNVKA